MSPSSFQRALIEANRKIYSRIEILKALKRRNWTDAKEKIFLNYQWAEIEKGVRRFIPFLKKIEDGLYDSDGHLHEDLLIQRVRKDTRWTFLAGNKTIETFGIPPLELPMAENVICTAKAYG